MHLTAQIILPTPNQVAALTHIQVAANAACTALNQGAWQQQCFSKFPLQQVRYNPIKQMFTPHDCDGYRQSQGSPG